MSIRRVKAIVRSWLPEWVLLAYHYVMAWCAAAYYRFPSRHLIVIGITGTKGKTSTAIFTHAALSNDTTSVGVISTAVIRIGHRQILNTYHMTMPSPWVIQRTMAQMRAEGCTYCVVETTSEGLKQYRHKGIWYDAAIFTNLSPEHLPSHGGSFERYRDAKARLFDAVAHRRVKRIHGQIVPRAIILNADDEHAHHYVRDVDHIVWYGIHSENASVRAEEIQTKDDGTVSFTCAGTTIALQTPGVFNVLNALGAIAVAHVYGQTIPSIAKSLQSVQTIPGRMERIEHTVGAFTVYVDYAHEKRSMTVAIAAARERAGANGRVIVLLGAEGGGRDTAKRAAMGTIVARDADIAIVTTVDPYDDNPYEIERDIADAAEQGGKVVGRDLFVIDDRRTAIAAAIALARDHDVILITGKGAEQTMIIGGRTIQWDDRDVVREELVRAITQRQKH